MPSARGTRSVRIAGRRSTLHTGGRQSCHPRWRARSFRQRTGAPAAGVQGAERGPEASSCCRAAAERSIRLATLAQAISRRSPTAPSSISSDCRMSPTSRSRSGVSRSRTPVLLSGNSFSSRAPAASSSPCACRSVTPGDNRASRLKIRSDRFSAWPGVLACAPPMVVHKANSADGNRNQGGVTPTTVNDVPDIEIVRPSTVGSPPKADCHKP